MNIQIKNAYYFDGVEAVSLRLRPDTHAPLVSAIALDVEYRSEMHVLEIIHKMRPVLDKPPIIVRYTQFARIVDDRTRRIGWIIEYPHGRQAAVRVLQAFRANLTPLAALSEPGWQLSGSSLAAI